MYQALSCSLLIALTFAPSALAQPARDRPAAIASGTAVIRGRVIEAATGKGLSRVQVRATTNLTGPPPDPYPWLAMTDADGRYEIKGLPAGTYAVVATKTNYVRNAWGEARIEGPGKRIPIADGQVLEKIDMQLTRTGVVTGKIVDEFGDPVTDVTVTAMRYQYVQGSRRLMPSGRGGGTNDIGEYRVYGLTPGQYFISATLRNFSGMNNETTDRSAYAPTFYPGTGNVSEAQRLTIVPGQTIAGTNLTLLPIQAARVTGIALDADGKPMANSMVSVSPRTGTMMYANGGAAVMPTGKFTLTLPPGEYTFRVFGPGGADGAAADVTVNGADIDGVQLIAMKAATIRGRMAFTDSATGAATPKPTAFDMGAWREWTMGQPVRHQAKIKDDGTFEITLPPGHVLLRGVPTGQPSGPNAPPAWRLNRVILNDIDVADSGIDVAGNATIENVVVEWTNHSNEVTGKVTDADGKVVRDCTVIVFAQDPVHWTVQTRHLSATRPGLDDLYHVRMLAGDYFIVAMSDVENSAWTDPDFLSQARERAVKFTIADGETKTIDLPLMPAPVF
jgi:hypothetical protein